MAREPNFDIPRSEMDARNRIRIVVAEIEDIETQLGDKQRRGKLEARGEVYEDWRNKTKWALMARRQEYRLLKLWIRYPDNFEREILSANHHSAAR